MIAPTIERLIASIAETYPPIALGDYVGFEMDAEHFLSETRSLVDLTINRTQNPLSIMEIRAKVAQSVKDLDTVKSAINNAWREMRYGREESYLETDSRAATFRFATLPSGGGYYISGTLRIEGAKYQKLFQIARAGELMERAMRQGGTEN